MFAAVNFHPRRLSTVLRYGTGVAAKRPPFNGLGYFLMRPEAARRADGTALVRVEQRTRHGLHAWGGPSGAWAQGTPAHQERAKEWREEDAPGRGPAAHGGGGASSPPPAKKQKRKRARWQEVEQKEDGGTAGDATIHPQRREERGRGGDKAARHDSLLSDEDGGGGRGDGGRVKMERGGKGGPSFGSLPGDDALARLLAMIDESAPDRPQPPPSPPPPPPPQPCQEARQAEPQPDGGDGEEALGHLWGWTVWGQPPAEDSGL
jgi:hypothetical protein